MTLKESVTTCLSKYTDFTGRAPRSEYWWFLVGQILAGFVVGFIAGFLGVMTGIGETLGNIASLILTIGLFLPALAVAIRRLHDIGKSGWWYLLVFIPVIGWLVLLYWFVQPTEPEANEYGEAPIL